MSVVYKQGKNEGGMYTPNNCGQRTAPAVDRDGVKLEVEHFPHLPYILAVDPSGNICCVAISTNRDPSEGFSASYEKTQVTRLKKRGWLVLGDDDVNVITDGRENKRAVITGADAIAEIKKRRDAAKRNALRFEREAQHTVEKMIEAYKAGVTAGADGTAIDPMKAVRPRSRAGE